MMTYFFWVVFPFIMTYALEQWIFKAHTCEIPIGHAALVEQSGWKAF